MNRFARRLITLFLFLLIFGIQFTGCAVIDRDHRHLTKAVERNVPENMVVSIATFPVWGLAGVVTLAVDGLIINPIMNIPASVDDATVAFLGFGIILPFELVLLPVRVVATVPLFLGSEILRCSIPFIFAPA